MYTGPGHVLVAIAIVLVVASALSPSRGELIVEMPKFAEPITNVTAPVGREATIVCIVDDLGSYKVAWLRVDTQTILTIHNHVITKNHRIGVSHSDHRTWNIHIKEVRESDKGWYMCQINTDPMKSQLGFLDIVVPPDILDYPTSTDMNIREGSNVSLRCAASGSPAPNITWRKEGTENIRLEHSQQVHSVEGPVLNLTRISRSHMGAYLCIASNGVPPSVSKRIMLVVNFPPMIWIQNQLIGAFIGQSLTLECLSEAHPKSINYWTREAGEIIAHGEKYEPEEFVTEQYKTRMKLTIKSVTAEDYGTYKCLSRNALGDTDGTIKIYQVANNGGHSTTRPKHRYKNRNRTRIRAQSNDIRDSAFLSKDENNELQTHYDDDGEFEEYDSGSQTHELAFYTAILCVIVLVYGHE
ncbi:neurotrimin-like [Acyrthosiphon pisum]|uniref:Ig-like domain-containing protein n=1 Tax=Acyrthosiphon pisum TaxID=7029 RepID=A0A8R2JRU0_ACYPI|nr:neurotrimin-like [Acyrthosiphon pisum]